ncbi:MAG: rod shape-determining protein RodA [Anaerolineales bacterium]|nr:rod shape-determining protein RodA [Anaerolineales bacterium]
MRDISWRHFDFWLLGAVALLTIFGITMIRSAIAGNIELIEGNTVQKQIIFAVGGFFVMILMAVLDYRLLAALSRPIYAVTAGTLIVLLLVGGALFGSARWFRLGPILIQPSEIAKIVIIIVLADFFTNNKDKLHNFGWVIRSFLLTLGLTIWILLQPDLSTSIVIFVLWFALLWAAGLQVRHLLFSAGAGLIAAVIGLPLLLITYDPNNTEGLIKPYQVERILNFIFPDPDASYGAIYNVQQALISIGSGGWFGKGYESGSQVQLRFLKVRHSDFIFSVLSEELGFVGAVVVIGLLVFIIFRCLRAARIAGDTFGALIAIGVATLLAFQATVNIGMNLNLLPVTGLVLPFVSYGGSSLLSMLLGIGLVESIVLRHKALEF